MEDRFNKRVSRGFRTLVAVPSLICCFGVLGYAQPTSDQPLQSWLDGPYLLGDWGGERTKLANMGITFSLISVAARPSPRHAVQGSPITEPVPPQAPQVRATEKNPC